MAASPTIEIKSLSKRYSGRKTYALKDLSLNVMPGEVYGFLGPNGAGKTTTIRTLLNFIQPSGGTATILGKNIVTDSVELKRFIGYLSGDVALYLKMTGKQMLDYMSELTPVKHKGYLQELISTYKAELNQPIGELSKGNRQKIGLIQAFMHEPEVLVLDEPTSGLDPLMQAAFFDYVKAVKASGASVFLSSHDLAEVQKMCDRIGFIREGRMVVEQSITELNREASQTYDVIFADKPPITQLRALGKIKIKPVGNNAVTAHVHGDLSPFLGVLARNKIISLERREVSLEEEFLRLYKGGER